MLRREYIHIYRPALVLINTHPQQRHKSPSLDRINRARTNFVVSRWIFPTSATLRCTCMIGISSSSNGWLQVGRSVIGCWVEQVLSASTSCWTSRSRRLSDTPSPQILGPEAFPLRRSTGDLGDLAN